jgi:hypothetical protein
MFAPFDQSLTGFVTPAEREGCELVKIGPDGRVIDGSENGGRRAVSRGRQNTAGEVGRLGE